MNISLKTLVLGSLCTAAVVFASGEVGPDQWPIVEEVDDIIAVSFFETNYMESSFNAPDPRHHRGEDRIERGAPDGPAIGAAPPALAPSGVTDDALYGPGQGCKARWLQCEASDNDRPDAGLDSRWALSR